MPSVLSGKGSAPHRGGCWSPGHGTCSGQALQCRSAKLLSGFSAQPLGCFCTQAVLGKTRNESTEGSWSRLNPSPGWAQLGVLSLGGSVWGLSLWRSALGPEFGLFSLESSAPGTQLRGLSLEGSAWGLSPRGSQLPAPHSTHSCSSGVSKHYMKVWGDESGAGAAGAEAERG